MINKERKRSKKEIVMITIGGTIALIAAIVLCFVSIRSEEEYIMHYSDSSELDYNVYLKPNTYYTTPSLPKNRMYISSLIEYIDTDFNYNFNVVEDLNLEYKYYINAKVVVEGEADKKIFEKEEMLVEETKPQQINNKKFSINEKVKIDYNKYNQLASSFIDEYGIAAKANIVVSMYVDVVGTHEKFEKKLNDSAVVSFVIPIATTNKMTEIKMNYDLTNNANEVFEYGKTSIAHPLLFVFALLIAIIDIAYVTYEIVMYIINKDVKVIYQERIKKIFRDYGRYISEKSMTTNTKEIMYTMSLRVEIVKTFDDLINVRDNLEKPILFYESVPGEQAVFYIIDTKVSYIYIMNARDLDRKKKKDSNSASVDEIKLADEEEKDNNKEESTEEVVEEVIEENNLFEEKDSEETASEEDDTQELETIASVLEKENNSQKDTKDKKQNQQRTYKSRNRRNNRSARYYYRNNQKNKSE